MYKRLIAVLLVAATTGYSQPAPTVATRLIAQNYDLDSTTAVACTASEVRVAARITTSGASTTTTAVTANTNPFVLASVGDIIRTLVPTTSGGVTTNIETTRVITAKASSDSVTVNSSWTLQSIGAGFTLIKPTCSAVTANTAQWIPVSTYPAGFSYSVSQINVTGGISFAVDGLFSDVNDPNPIVVNLWPGVVSADAKCGAGTYSSTYCKYTSTFTGETFSTGNDFRPKALRLRMLIDSADDGTDTGAAAEQVNIVFTEGR
jgi:hypothetical protein